MSDLPKLPDLPPTEGKAPREPEPAAETGTPQASLAQALDQVPEPVPEPGPAVAPGEVQAASLVEVPPITSAEPPPDSLPVSHAEWPAASPAAAPTDTGAAPTPATAGDGLVVADPSADLPATATPQPTQLSPAACADLLKQHFPALFTGGAKPLKLRIQADIQQRAPGVFSKGALAAFFRRYTGSTGYLLALSKASQRLDLDGQAAGELSDEHRQLAREELDRRRQLRNEREQQARAAQRQQAPQAVGEASAAAGTLPASADGRDTRGERRPRPEGAPRPDRGPRPPRPQHNRGKDRGAAQPQRPPRDRDPGHAAEGAAERRPDRQPQGGAQAGQSSQPRGAHPERIEGTERHERHERHERQPIAAAMPALPAAVAETDEARQARQDREARRALLRDFDRSPLTLANFCVLKRLKPEALTPLLAQARKEAALEPRPSQPQDEQRTSTGPRRDERQDGRRDDRRPGRPAERGGARPDARRPRGPSGGQS